MSTSHKSNKLKAEENCKLCVHSFGIVSTDRVLELEDRSTTCIISYGNVSWGGEGDWYIK